ncbi:hypothetical protein [Saccharothrix deserti]|uniref:hypothetical protein n=1 Tax=Saccharothrix deserti TaxID=2593674 RepID=UPI00192E3623|nr:hypothetical protein [Saccharothrix deserti]
MSARTWLRAGLVFLAVSQGLAGVVQLLLPRLFYDKVPTPDHPWVSVLPPYNEHLMRDVGAATLAYTFVLAVAAVTVERRLVRTALIANLLFTVSTLLFIVHSVFHTTHLHDLPPGDALAQAVSRWAWAS